MKKQFTTALILIFILGLVPINFSEAITQNQINAEVQIVCPDNYGNWYSGSGTIINPKGIILTNKHVVSDQYGGIIKTCFIGFTESINQEPNFGTQSNPNLAEVKYYTTASDMDAAILYLNNPTNKSYTYVDIWNSNSNTLQFGHKIEAIGFPSIGGSTITYTSGDFSGFGSASDGTQNYIKATTPLEHGNSGGAAYNPAGQFIGIPTMVVAGTLNSLSYILSVNSIKKWLLGVLGDQYKEEVIEQSSAPVKPTVNIQNDITPPNFNNLTQLCFNVYDKAENELTEYGARCFPNKMGKVEEFNIIQFVLYKRMLSQIDENNITKIYYYFDSKPHSIIDSLAKIHTTTNYKSDRLTISDIIEIKNPGSYYFSFFAQDSNGNISNPFVYQYVYEPDIFKDINKLFFYRNNNLTDPLLGFDVDFRSEPSNYEHRPIECKTRLKNLTITWDYPNNYNNYAVKNVNACDSLKASTVKGDLVENNFTFDNLYHGKSVPYNGHFWETQGFLREKAVFYAFYLKPVLEGGDESLDYHHHMISLIYNSNLDSDLVCRGGNIFKETEQIPDINLINRLKGRIILQVEVHGEAYYVNPKDSKKYYMADGSEAYRIMRFLGIGITNSNLDKIKSDSSFGKQHSGKIFLQVEAHGEAFYIDIDGKAHYLKDGEAAYYIMRDLGLGITNNDLSKIPEGNL